MKIISHRGNLDGRIPKMENNPSYIKAAIEDGYDVEIDVWYVDGEFYLGHDIPQHVVVRSWLEQFGDVLWCHAKNSDGFTELLKYNINCFWHENDRFTLTSKRIPWCFPGNYQQNGITVIHGTPEETILPCEIYGICTDHPIKWKNI